MLILLAIFLLPALYTSPGQVDPNLFAQPGAHLGILIQNVPRLLLLLYLMELDGGEWIGRFGLSIDIKRLLPASLGVAFILFALGAGTNWASHALGVAGEPPFELSSPPLSAYILSGFSFLSVGYMEELFFRSYAITRLRQLGLSDRASILVGALLFSAGHLYQGAEGLLFALLAALALGFLFDRYRRAHPLALGHAVYNYVGLLISGVP
mgnify:CR=1 FL=1